MLDAADARGTPSIGDTIYDRYPGLTRDEDDGRDDPVLEIDFGEKRGPGRGR